MSIPDNLTEATRTTLVQAHGLNKSHRPAILSPVVVTTPDIGKTLIHTLEKQYTCAKGNLPCNRE